MLNNPIRYGDPSGNKPLDMDGCWKNGKITCGGGGVGGGGGGGGGQGGGGGAGVGGSNIVVPVGITAAIILPQAAPIMVNPVGAAVVITVVGGGLICYATECWNYLDDVGRGVYSGLEGTAEGIAWGGDTVLDGLGLGADQLGDGLDAAWGTMFSGGDGGYNFKEKYADYPGRGELAGLYSGEQNRLLDGWFKGAEAERAPEPLTTDTLEQYHETARRVIDGDYGEAARKAGEGEQTRRKNMIERELRDRGQEP